MKRGKNTKKTTSVGTGRTVDNEPTPLTITITNTLKRHYFNNPKKTFIVTGATLITLIILAVLVDILLPFHTWGNIIRALLAIAGSAATYTTMFYTNMFYIQSKRAVTPNYTTPKEKLSPSWRIRVSLVAATILTILIFAVGHTPLYTTTNYFVIAGFLALVTFTAKTPEETEREYYGIPDNRDRAYAQALENLKNKKQ